MAEIQKQFVLYKDDRGEWRWRLFAANNSDVLADSGEGYKNKADAIRGASLVASVANGAGIWNHTDQKWEP